MALTGDTLPGVRVHLGSDHAGLELKTAIAEHVRAAGHEVVDHGPVVYEDTDDYPTYCLRAGQGVVADPGSLGVVIGGSGNGEQIAANKVPGVRAALAWSVETALLGRAHNDANVVAIGARMHPVADALVFVDTFLGTAFSGEQRHSRRIAELAAFEADGTLPELPAP